jgi:hypothetical protein
MIPILLPCPHCTCFVEILELNCRIFRHGIYKENGQQINPHAPKAECDTLFSEGRIYGCGKPFTVVQNDDAWEAQVCDYV